MSVTPDQENQLFHLLAAAVHRLGGSIELTEPERAELEQAYGDPGPLLVGTDRDGTTFAAMYTVAEIADKAWPWIQRVVECDENEARALAQRMQAQLRAGEAVHAAVKTIRAQVQADGRN